MREILFRGKRIDNGEWVIGFLSKTRGLDNKLHICIDYEEKGVMCSSIVIPETVSQYTGLTDKNGNKIFEGDIVEINKRKKYEVRFYKSAWVIWNDKYKFDYEKWDFLSTFAQKIKIIGNIHDNPELLKEAERE